ncbi:MAG: ABC transporter substrate-binding protein [Chloroflexota bacterium]
MEERPTRRRLTAAFGALAIIVAACSSSGGSAAPASAPAASAPAASAAASAAESAAASAGESAGASGGASAPAGSGGTGALPSFQNIGGSVSVYGTWTGAEQDSFMAMIQPWKDGTGVQVNYTGQRDLPTAISTGIAGGNLPDVAGLPGPGQMLQYYDQGVLKPLDFVDFAAYEGATPPGFAALGKAPDGKLAGIFTKGAVKGLIWYNTKNWKETTPPTTWDDLNSKAKAAATGDTKEWCIGLESGGDSGWPGTDWIEDFVIRQSGPDVYDKWVKGEQKWTSPEIKQAFTAFGDAVSNAHGGANYINTTNFGKAANPMFTTPPGCLLHHQASFITDFFKNEAKAQPTDYDFFQMPDINSQFAGSITGGGDLFGMFHDTPQAQSLINWMLTPQAQEIWVKRGGFISANKGVPIDSYPDAQSKKAAQILSSAKTFRFDGSDLMPAAMVKPFNQAMVKFAQNPGDLDNILSQLDQVQADAYSK